MCVVYSTYQQFLPQSFASQFPGPPGTPQVPTHYPGEREGEKGGEGWRERERERERGRGREGERVCVCERERGKREGGSEGVKSHN